MSVTIKTAREIELMREAGRLWKKSTMSVQNLSDRGSAPWILTVMEKNLSGAWAAHPNFLNYNGYPALSAFL